ncbi:hypothetical protein BJX63DRAFT_436419 [Aspergillus granulosus]|uniref:Zn(2)-C6 fungal-type domain-containing protein n=1 Tax=Aspergillus granulosus TaxID=176169 RepID=A0ABR4GY55_9EURO
MLKPAGQPKLRSSCDRCGAAKVKCDRKQPECGRCVSYGMTCVYGVSRKMGKPPRRPSLSQTLGSPHTVPTGGNMDVCRESGSPSNGGITMDLEQFSIMSDLSPSASWNAMDYQTPCPSDNLERSLKLFDEFYNDLSGPLLLDNFPIPAAEHPSSPLYASASSDNPCPRSTPPSYKFVDTFDPAATPIPNSGIHDCARDANEILHSLSCLNIDAVPPDSHLPTPPTSASSTTHAVESRIPLDRLLLLNRDAAERLVPLLSCHCARSPHLALQYASIISRMLTWYQRAAGCAQTPRQSPPPASTTGTRNAGSSAIGTPIRSPGLSVAPARMAVGTFSVDDSRLQKAMRMQLLSGEVRRVGDLIEQLGLDEPDTRCTSDESAFGDVESLYQSLTVWLKRDYSRIINMLKANLREINM